MLNIIVCAKHSYDVQQLRYDKASGQFLLAEAPRKMSDMDRRALEEALRIREKYGGKVVVVTVGDQDSVDTIRQAYAMGADEGYVVINRDYENLDTNTIALLLASAVRRIGNFNLILCGSKSTDGYSGQVPPKVAAYLGLPIINYVRELRIEGDYLIASSDYEDGVYTYRVKMPAVVAVTLEINEPRSPTPTAILRALRKPITQWTPGDLGISEVKARLRVIKTYIPETTRKRVIIDASTDDKVPEAVRRLVDALIQEGIIR